MDRIQEIEETVRLLKNTAMPITENAYIEDIEYLLSEVKRYKEGYEVLSAMPMHMHPSEIIDFSKRMLKGEKPYALNED